MVGILARSRSAAPSALRRVPGIDQLLVECGQRPDDGRTNRHRMRILRQGFVKPFHVLVNHRVVFDLVHEMVELFLSRQPAVNEEVGNLDEVALFGKLFDGIAAIPQNAFFAVEKRTAL